MALRERILDQCFDASENTQGTNNHLDLKRIREDIELRQEVIGQLGLGIMEQYSPEFIISVPTEGPWLADAIAVRHDLPSVHLIARRDHPDSEERVAFESGVDKITCKDLSRGVIVASVLDHFEVIKKALAVPEVGSRAIGAAAIWNRGDATREPLTIPVTSLIEEYIPAILPPSSPLRKYARG
jgi:hypothetical protein